MDTVLWLCPSPTEALKWLLSLPILMQEPFWWWQCSDRYKSPSSPTSIPLPPPPYPFSPSLVSLMVSVDVKHHVYLRIQNTTSSFFWANSFSSPPPPLSLEIYQINHTLITTINFQLNHSQIINTAFHCFGYYPFAQWYSLFIHTNIFSLCLLHLLIFCGLQKLLLNILMNWILSNLLIWIFITNDISVTWVASLASSV